MPQRDRQKQALTRLQRRVDWLTEQISTQTSGDVIENATFNLGGSQGGGNSVSVLTLNASTQDVNETLPAPEEGKKLIYIRKDDNDTYTATIEDPSSNDIYIFGEANAPTYDLSTRERVFLVSDGTSWYVEDFRGSVSVGVEELSDLSDVDSALQSDGNVLASGGAAYREEGIASLTESHVGVDDLSDVASVSQTDGSVLASDGTALSTEALGQLLTDHGALTDLGAVSNVTQSDGSVLASDGTALSTEGISSVLQDHAQHSDLQGIGPNDHHAQDHDHTSADVSTVPNAGLVNDSVTVAGRSVSLGGQTGVLAEDLSNVVSQNRSDGDTLVYDDPATQYIHLSISDLIKEYSDTGIFNDVLVGGVAVIRSDTEPTVAEWETELGRTLSNNEVPENVIWVNSSTSPSTTLAYDPEATSGFQQASYARSGYWIEYATGLLDAGLFTDGDIEADDIIAEGSITGNEIKSETTITIGTNTQFILDGINDRFYSTDYSAGTDGFEIDLKNSESQLPNLDVVGTLDADTWDQSLSEHTNVSVSAPADGDVLSHDGSGFGNEGIASVTEDHVGVGDLSDVADASQDGKIIADQGGTYGVEAVSTVTQDHVAAENLANIIAQNRSDGDLLAYIGSNSRYEHRSVNDAIQEFADTGIFNDVLVGGVASIRSDTEPTEADWDAELPGRSVPPVPDNVIWVDTDSSGTPTLTFYDSDATAGYQQASYAKGGYWVEKPTGLIDAGLITEGNVEATDIIADGTITGNKIKSETTITIGTNRQFVIDGINDRFYSTNYNKGQAGIEIDLTNFESQLEGLTVIGELDAGVWDQSLSEHTNVSVSSASDSDVLAHDGTQFVNEGIAALLTDHAQIQDLGNVPAPSTDGQVIADQGGTYANEAISSLTESHVTLSDLDKVGINNKSDGHVLVETGGGWANEGISVVLGDHADWSAMQNVAVGSAENREVAFYDTSTSPSQWSPEHVADIIRDRGSLSIGDVSVAGSWRTIESATEPTQRPNGDPLKDGDVWIDTDASPVAEAYVYRNGSFIKQATAIGGNNIVTDSVSADKVVTGTLTAEEIKAGTITSKEVDTNNLFADNAAIDTLTSEQAFIDDIENITFTGQSATIERLLEVGTGTPTIQIDGTTNRIESTNFASLTSGFRIAADGFAEFGDIRARGAIRSAVFERDEQVLRGGTDIVTPSTTLVQDASSSDTTIEVDDVPFSTGDDIRFKEGSTTEVRTISSISGTTLTLNNALNNSWGSGAAIARWNAERIVNTSDSTFAPFTSYVDDSNQEQVRVGNLAGLAGRTGYGISVGKGSMFYDSAEDKLSVSGLIFADTGRIGPFNFNSRGLGGKGLNLNASAGSLSFLSSSNGSDLTGNVTNNDFSTGDTTGWTEYYPATVLQDNTSDYHASPNQFNSPPNNLNYWLGEVRQEVDLSGFGGDDAEATLTLYQNGFSDYRVEVFDNVANEKIAETEPDWDSTTQKRDLTIEFTLPPDASKVEFQVYMKATSATIDGTQDKDQARFYDLSLRVGDVKAKYGSENMQMFDNTGAKTIDVDRLTGNIEINGGLGAYGTSAPSQQSLNGIGSSDGVMQSTGLTDVDNNFEEILQVLSAYGLIEIT